MKSKRHGCGGHIWVTVVVGVAALATGFVVGRLWTFGLWAGQDLEAVVDCLTQPFPIPKEAKFLKEFRPSGTSSIHSDRPCELEWRAGRVYDVASVAPEVVRKMPGDIIRHFQSRLAFEGDRSSGMTHPEWGNDLYFGGPGWTWGVSSELRGKDIKLVLLSEVFEFRPDPKGGLRLRVPVKDLAAPVQGRRVLWVSYTFEGRNLRYGPKAWPPPPPLEPETAEADGPERATTLPAEER